MTRKGGKPPMLCNDVIRGAAELALNIFGDRSKRRAVYGMSDERKRAHGIYYDGKTMCARRSVLFARVGIPPSSGEADPAKSSREAQ